MSARLENIAPAVMRLMNFVRMVKLFIMELTNVLLVPQVTAANSTHNQQFATKDNTQTHPLLSGALLVLWAMLAPAGINPLAVHQDMLNFQSLVVTAGQCPKNVDLMTTEMA